LLYWLLWDVGGGFVVSDTAWLSGNILVKE